MDSGTHYPLGYEPRVSALKFNGAREAWPNYQWSLRATVSTFGEFGLPMLDGKFEDLAAKTKTSLLKVKTEAKGNQAEIEACGKDVDKKIDVLPAMLQAIKNKVCGVLVTSITGNAIQLVRSIAVDDPHAMYQRLKTEFEGTSSGASIMALYQKAALIRHDAGTPLSATLSSFEDIHRRMVEKKETPSNNYRVGQLLACLPPSYDNIKGSMLVADKDWTWEDAVAKLIAHQESTALSQNPRRAKSADAYAVTTTQSRPAGSTCYNCQRSGHMTFDCRTTCIKCPPPAAQHPASQCPKFAHKRGSNRGRGRGGKGRGGKTGSQTAAIASEEKQSAWLVTHQAMLTKNPKEAPLNVLDSACTIHILAKNQKSKSKLLAEPTDVSTASGEKLQLRHGGKARIYFQDDCGNRNSADLNGALISPTLDFNLISVSRLDKAGLTVTFGAGKALVLQNKMVLAAGTLGNDGLYTLNSCSPSHHRLFFILCLFDYSTDIGDPWN